MRLKFEVIVSSNKNNGEKLDVEIRRPNKVPKKWGALVLLTHLGILKGLQNAYKVIDGQMVDEQNNIESKQPEGVSDNTGPGTTC